MGRIASGFYVALGLLLASCASGPRVVPEPAKNAAGYAVGYLAAPPDARAFLAQPPADGSLLQQGELAEVVAKNADKGARFAQAVADDKIDPFAAFAAPFGKTLSAAETPSLARVLARVDTDIADAYDPAKEAFGRSRPFLEAPSIGICVGGEWRAKIGATKSYPSGHAAYGWAWALILAEMVPEKGDLLLARGRDFGDSRIVCGVHYPSDVAAGRVVASAIVARLDDDAIFRRDRALARQELRRALGLRP